VSAGSTIYFAISTQSEGAAYTFKVYRLGYYHGAGARLMETRAGQTGYDQGWFVNDATLPDGNTTLPHDCPSCQFDPPDALGQHTYMLDAHWQISQTLHIPADWLSGYYVVLLTTAHNKQSYIPFIVRNDTRLTPYLMQANVATWQAYNLWGGYNVYGKYTHGVADFARRARVVSFNRPYTQNFGAGDLFYDEYSMVRFLERFGYEVTYVTNLDISDRPYIVRQHPGLIIAGHDEYWDAGERAAVEHGAHDHLDLLVFAGNEAYHQVRYQPDGSGSPRRELVAYKDLTDPAYKNLQTRPLTTVLWRDPPVNQPENALFGVMWQSGAEHEADIPNDFIAKHTDRWMYAGTNLHDGDHIHGIIGYEVDSLAPNSGTPANVVVLGQSPSQEYGTAKAIDSTAVIWYPGLANFVFDGATIDWAFGLDDFARFWPRSTFSITPDARLQKLTVNLLNAVTHPNAVIR
jgi:hypothetical protein